jgi:hypothetical protein
VHEHEIYVALKRICLPYGFQVWAGVLASVIFEPNNYKGVERNAAFNGLFSFLVVRGTDEVQPVFAVIDSEMAHSSALAGLLEKSAAPIAHARGNLARERKRIIEIADRLIGSEQRFSADREPISPPQRFTQDALEWELLLALPPQPPSSEESLDADEFAKQERADFMRRRVTYIAKRHRKIAIWPEAALKTFLAFDSNQSSWPEGERLHRTSSVDMLVTSAPPNCEPIVAVEFDGTRFHRSPKAQQNDKTKNAMFDLAGLPLFRVRSRELRSGAKEHFAKTPVAERWTLRLADVNLKAALVARIVERVLVRRERQAHYAPLWEAKIARTAQIYRDRFGEDLERLPAEPTAREAADQSVWDQVQLEFMEIEWQYQATDTTEEAELIDAQARDERRRWAQQTLEDYGATEFTYNCKRDGGAVTASLSFCIPTLRLCVNDGIEDLSITNAHGLAFLDPEDLEVEILDLLAHRGLQTALAAGAQKTEVAKKRLAEEEAKRTRLREIHRQRLGRK